MINEELWIGGAQSFSNIESAFWLFGYDAPKSEERRSVNPERGVYVKTILKQYQTVLTEEQCFAIIWYGIRHTPRELLRKWVWNRKPVLDDALLDYRVHVARGRRAMSMIANNEWIGAFASAFRRVGLAFQLYCHVAPLPDNDREGKPTSGAYVMNILDQYRQYLSDEKTKAIIWYGLTNDEKYLSLQELEHPSLLDLVEAYRTSVASQEDSDARITMNQP